ncbi:probable LRR receptor-like serine/threonine-protein kinase At5g48740 [Nymphaea colorata]|nr:probable LRR receptor-like serine/threonine-protein kinase At5g48740 [Nymphaea colorata]
MDQRRFFIGVLFVSGIFVPAFGDPPGFLSIICGGEAFVDLRNISWTSDSAYVATGNATAVRVAEPNVLTSSSSVPLRFFPDTSDDRKCYRIPLQNLSAERILVRSRFYYKNYDGLRRPPYFFVSLGTAKVATVNLSRSDPWEEEFVWPVLKDTLPLCLLPIPGGGFPVISSLEVRPLPPGAYKDGTGSFSNKTLRKKFRVNCGSANRSVRYPLDQYDRIWDGDQDFSPSHLAAGLDIQLGFNVSRVKEAPPLRVLQSARVLARKDILNYTFIIEKTADYYLILYFAGIIPVSSSFSVLINGNVVRANYTVASSEVSALSIQRKSISSLTVELRNSSYYPLVNAIEIYEVVEIPPECSSTTVSALQIIYESSGLNLGWGDDPCSPTVWKRVGCQGSLLVSLDLSDINLRVIGPTFSDLLDLLSLDLHNASLTGQVENLGSLQQLETLNLSFNALTSFGSEFSTLFNLQTLDLQNNSLEGTVPDILGSLQNLHLLNLENNKLHGPLPQSLNKQSLLVRTSGNVCLGFRPLTCSTAPTIPTPEFTVVKIKKHHKHSWKAIIIGLFSGAIISLVIIAISAFLCRKRKKSESAIGSTAGAQYLNWDETVTFSYNEIKTATNNFKKTLGHGSFGSVYLGKLPDGKQVAVKVKYDQTQLGSESFYNEVALLSQVTHPNLVSLVGVCHEHKQQILVYEYVPGGSLADNLYGSNSRRIRLNWIRRLKIAVDAAKGLEYLHNQMNPRFIHRDVKSSNILLDLDMNAKLSDFGLSKQVCQGDSSHISTGVKGTAGYLDPEYYSTQQLTEKSDVYSFGVVLLELICGREPLNHSGAPDSFNLVLWAKPYLQAGTLEVVDENLKGSFDPQSMKLVALVAIRSVDSEASRRPTMAEVLADLKEAYSIQLAYISASGQSP